MNDEEGAGNSISSAHTHTHTYTTSIRAVEGPFLSLLPKKAGAEMARKGKLEPWSGVTVKTVV